MVVFLTSDAFISLIVSCIEVYRKETAGILTGDYIFNSDTYYIKGAIPLQSANRKFSEVEYHLARTQRMRENLELCLSDFIGYFHSHPQYFNMKITSALSQAAHPEAEFHRVNGRIARIRKEIPAHYIRTRASSRSRMCNSSSWPDRRPRAGFRVPVSGGRSEIA